MTAEEWRTLALMLAVSAAVMAAGLVGLILDRRRR